MRSPPIKPSSQGKNKMRRVVIALIGFVSSFSVAAQTAPAPAPAPNDYSNPKTWLCRPGQHDACDVDLTTTVVSASGKLSRETWAADAKAPIDCFYVYPTVSTDPTPYSDMNPDPAEM